MTGQYIEELIQKYAQGTATKAEVEQLMSWYRSAVISDVEWPSARSNEKDILSSRMLGRLLSDVKPQRKPVIAMRWFKVAAILIPCIGLALLFLTKAPTNKYVTVVNPSGKIQLVRLPDGSQVWLNAATKLQYRKSFRDHREILLDGEAFFDVRRDLAHPFAIKSGDVTTTVLGTSFNVKAYATDTVAVVTVVTGRVGVNAGTSSLATLNPTDQLQFNSVTKKAIINAGDTSGAVAWRKGRLVFEGKSLAEISQTIEQWYGVKLVFKHPAMKSCRYYMSFANTIPLDTLLSTMSEITNMTYKVDLNNNKVELSGEGCN